MFIQSHLVHEIFTYGFKGSFLILFAAYDKLIKYAKQKIKKVWVPFQLFTEWLVQSVQHVWDTVSSNLAGIETADKRM